MTAIATLERPAPFVPPSPPGDAQRRGAALWLKVVAVTTSIVAVAALVVVMARPSAAEKKDATIQSYAFTPASMTVHVGDTVTWTNNDTAPHTITSSSGPAKMDSPTLNKGDTYSYTFTVAGTYQYFCAIHPDMKATVVVEPAAAPVTAAPAAVAPAATDHAAMAPMAPMTPAPAAPAAAPPASTAPVSSPPGMAAPVPATACTGQSVASAMLSPLVTHLEKAHLETSPGQQVGDLLSVDQYVKTHTVLLEAILSPLLDVLMALPQGLTPLVVHLDKAHLETSPGQQAADLLAVDQYVKTHTVLAENILSPALATAAGC